MRKRERGFVSWRKIERVFYESVRERERERERERKECMSERERY